MSSYEDYTPKTVKPKRKLLDLSNCYSMQEVDGSWFIVSDFEDVTDSILTRCKVYDYEAVKAKLKVIEILIDKNPTLFDGMKVEVVDE